MNQEKLEKVLKLVADSSKAVNFDDKLQEIIDNELDMDEDDLDMVAGGIKIPEWKPE